MQVSATAAASKEQLGLSKLAKAAPWWAFRKAQHVETDALDGNWLDFGYLLPAPARRNLASQHHPSFCHGLSGTFCMRMGIAHASCSEC
jgi:hypothetical protein